MIKMKIRLKLTKTLKMRIAETSRMLRTAFGGASYNYYYFSLNIDESGAIGFRGELIDCIPKIGRTYDIKSGKFYNC
jgi:hypothetical protein